MKFVKITHDVPKGSFDCGNSSINRLVYESYYPTLLQHGYAYSVVDGEEIIGYWMMSFRTIAFDKAPEELKNHQSDLVNFVPTVHINYIAIDEKHQGKKIGTKVMANIIQGILNLRWLYPVRIITLDSLTELFLWYKKMGFSPFDNTDIYTLSSQEYVASTIPMYFDCIIDIDALNSYCDE